MYGLSYGDSSMALSIIADIIFTLSSGETMFDEEGARDAFVLTFS